MPDPLKHEVHLHNALREKLRAEFPDIDDETLHDTLEGMTDLTDMIAYTVRSCGDDEAMASGLSDRIGLMQVRLGRFKARVARKRQIVTDAMEAAGIPKITRPEFTLSLTHRAGTAVVVDEQLIPPRFFETKLVLLKGELNKAVKALKAGESIPGATLGNGSVGLTVRTK